MRKRTRTAIITDIILLCAMILSGCKAEKFTAPPFLSTNVAMNIPSAVIVTFTAVGTTTPAIASIPNGGQADVHAVVNNSAGTPLSGVSVTFSVTGGATVGTLSSTTATTDVSGVATTTLTAVATDQLVTVVASAALSSGGTVTNNGSITVGTITNPPSSVGVTFAAVGTTTPAITSISNPGAVPDFGQAEVRVLVRDAATSPLAGLTVNFSVQGGAATGTFSAASAVTDAAGIATVTYTSTIIDTLATITASVTSGGTTVNNSGILTVGSPPPPIPTNITLAVSPLITSIMGQATITVTAVEGTNPAYSTPIDLTITSGAALGSFSNTDPTVDTLTGLLTDMGGVLTATFYAGTTSGLVTIQARATAPLIDIVKTQSLNVTSDPANIDLTAAITSLTLSQSTQLTADVRNIMNSAVPDGTMVDFTITFGNGSLSSATAPTIGGLANVTFTADNAQIGPVFLQASWGSGAVTSPTILISVSQAATGSITFDSATPATITVQGASPTSSLVKFIVKDQFGNVQNNVNVNFTLFAPTGAALSQASAVSNASGVVSTTLISGNVAGPARIVATDPIAGLSTSGTVAIGGGVPSYDHFDIAVSRVNLEGFNCNGIETTIYAYAADRFGNFNVPRNTIVSFTTEAGSVNTSGLTNDTGQTSVKLRTQSPLPMDVTPQAAGWPNNGGVEPSYTVGTRTYNPRDGWVTVLVSMTGEESFTDSNANGLYDSIPVPEAMTDLPEPYIDVNDSGSWVAGEQFFDWPSTVTPTAPNPANPNGVHEDPNGVWDAQIPIFKSHTLVFTSAPSIGDTAAGVLTSRIECVDPACATAIDSMTIPLGQSRRFKVYVSDINMNTLMPGTSVNVVSSPKGKADVTQGSPYTIGDGLSYGPTILDVVLTNNLTAGTDPTTQVNLKAEITWPGGCVSPALKTGVLYPGVITMTPF